MFLELTEDSLSQYLSSNKKVMVQYAASWCGNCRIMKPKFKKLAAENEDVAFLIVDAEKFPESRQFVQNTTPEQLEATLEVLEAFCEFRGVSESEIDVAGELITNICGALEVQQMVKDGAAETAALNAFGQKVMGSIDR
ncbi:MAG: thioredoxin [Pedobacter sp.]|nr:MAG: thioredoxin [Pedobacter sp.]